MMSRRYLIPALVLQLVLLCLNTESTSGFLLPRLRLSTVQVLPVSVVRPSSESKRSMSIPNAIDTFTSGIASICRLPKGTTVRLPVPGKAVIDPPRLKELYDIENSLSCRKVRELITELDLVVETVIPSAVNSRVMTTVGYPYALPVEGTKTVIPRLVLVATDGQEKVLLGEAAICDALHAIYSESPSDPTPDESITKEKALDILREIGNYIATACRVGRGMRVSPAAAATLINVPRPKQPLALYSYEGNQFCRLVREVLTELDLPYQLRSAGKESPRREELATVSTTGSTICPYLLDPNTNTAMAESVDIIRYLYKTYALWTPPNEILQWASDVVLPLAKPIFSVLVPLQAGSFDKENEEKYREKIALARADIDSTIRLSPVVIYTYGLSPFSFETKALLDNLDMPYKEVSLGAEWIPGLIESGGSETRAALLAMTGQSSLPHIFIGGTSIGGLFSGTPGLLPLLERGELQAMVDKATRDEQ